MLLLILIFLLSDYVYRLSAYYALKPHTTQSGDGWVPFFVIIAIHVVH